MKIANVAGRPALIRGGEYMDIATASGGRFADDSAVFHSWKAFVEWTTSLGAAAAWEQLPPEPLLGAPVTSPRQVIGVGLNYAPHREEVAAAEGYGKVDVPLIFTKWPSAICGPTDNVELSSERCDYEAELVIVVGARADRINPAVAWEHVAGLTAGQDISDRRIQYMKPNQVTLGKSLRTFSPIGPLVVTPDEFDDADTIEFTCEVNGECRQRASTSEMIRGVPVLVSFLSGFITLLPGDLIFTGTPTGIGHRMNPPRFLEAGDVIVTNFEHIGTMRNRCVRGVDPLAPPTVA